MDRRTLERGYYRVLSTIYRPWRYFARCLEVLSRYPKRSASPHIWRKIRLREITGLLNSLARQLFSRYGFAYVAYMARAILKRPDVIVSIVTMAIQGHQYFTVTRSVIGAQRQRVRLERAVSDSDLIRDTINRLVPEPLAAT